MIWVSMIAKGVVLCFLMLLIAEIAVQPPAQNKDTRKIAVMLLVLLVMAVADFWR